MWLQMGMRGIVSALVLGLGLGSLSAAPNVAHALMAGGKYAKRGTIEVGGAISAAHVAGGDFEGTTLRIAPQVGYFVANKLSLGVRPGVVLQLGGSEPVRIPSGDLPVVGDLELALNGAQTVFLGVSVPFGATWRRVLELVPDPREKARGNKQYEPKVSFLTGASVGVKIVLESALLLDVGVDYRARFLEPVEHEGSLHVGLATFFGKRSTLTQQGPQPAGW